MSHLQSLFEYCLTQNYKLEICTLSLIRDTVKSILGYGDAKLITVVQSCFVILRLLFVQKAGSEVIFQIAPYSRKSIIAYLISLRHDVMIYTSQYRWDLEDSTYIRQRIPLSWQYLQRNCVLYGYTYPVLSNSQFKNIGRVIPHSLPDYFYHKANTRERKNPETIKVGYVGRINEFKKVNEFAQFLSHNCNLNLHVAGPMKRNFKLDVNCIYHGVFTRDKLIEFLDGMDIIVLPSERAYLNKSTIWEDVFGLCLLEAASRGCSIIYPDLQGPASVFSEFPSAICLHSLYNSPEPWRIIEKLAQKARIGGKGNKHMARKYSKQRVGRLWSDVIS